MENRTENTVPEQNAAQELNAAGLAKEYQGLNLQKSSSKKEKAKNPTAEEIILDFLRKCSTFEADAIRIAVAIADSPSGKSTMIASDDITLNNYLNDGIELNGISFDLLFAHRIARAKALSARTSDFVDKSKALLIMGSLMDIAMNRQRVSRSLELLNKPQK